MFSFVSGHFIPIAVAILVWTFYLILSKRYRDKSFFKRETARHKNRAFFAIKQLTSSPYTDYAFAVLAWSQSDLLSIFAQHGMSKEQKKSLGGLYALALNIPLQHAKRTLFTEKPRSLISTMDENSAEKIRSAIHNLSNSSASDVKLSISIFNIIAYNQLVYHPFSRGSIDIKQSDFYCVHPHMFPNQRMRKNIVDTLSAVKQNFIKIYNNLEGYDGKTSFELLRENAHELQQQINWESVYGRDEESINFDPRVSFVLKIISSLAHMTRSRPCYMSKDDFQIIQVNFLDSMINIYESCEQLLELGDEDFKNSTNIYLSTCKSMSENLLLIYDLLGLDFALLSNCVEKQRGRKDLYDLPMSPKIIKKKFGIFKKQKELNIKSAAMFSVWN